MKRVSHEYQRGITQIRKVGRQRSSPRLRNLTLGVPVANPDAQPRIITAQLHRALPASALRDPAVFSHQFSLIQLFNFPFRLLFLSILLPERETKKREKTETERREREGRERERARKRRCSGTSHGCRTQP